MPTRQELISSLIRTKWVFWVINQTRLDEKLLSETEIIHKSDTAIPLLHWRRTTAAAQESTIWPSTAHQAWSTGGSRVTWGPETTSERPRQRTQQKWKLGLFSWTRHWFTHRNWTKTQTKIFYRFESLSLYYIHLPPPGGWVFKCQEVKHRKMKNFQTN